MDNAWALVPGMYKRAHVQQPRFERPTIGPVTDLTPRIMQYICMLSRECIYPRTIGIAFSMPLCRQIHSRCCLDLLKMDFNWRYIKIRCFFYFSIIKCHRVIYRNLFGTLFIENFFIFRSNENPIKNRPTYFTSFYIVMYNLQLGATTRKFE